jgi:hypothetical protein
MGPFYIDPVKTAINCCLAAFYGFMKKDVAVGVSFVDAMFCSLSV